LDEENAGKVIDQALSAGVDAIAICLINAYLNPVHEQRLYELVRMRSSTQVCMSSEIDPDIGEYERTSTTAVNTALIPVATNYFAKLEGSLRRLKVPLLVMQSNGGMMSSDLARRRPANMLESGPAAGVLAATRLANELGIKNVLSFDMGGTTAKACLLIDGKPLERASSEIGTARTQAGRSGDGHVVSVPSFDILEIGAGGGSIAWADPGGVLRVGPRSAGAVPGPACYGRGGTEATITDANVVLGYMNPERIAGGRVAVDRDAARRAIERIGEQLNLGTLDAALGICRVANSVMTRALRGVSSERGHDPRESTMVAFGGSGPLHATALAEDLDIGTVIVPPFPGLYSALGLLLADYRLDRMRPVTRPLASVGVAEVRRELEVMRSGALHEMGLSSAELADARFEFSADLRYRHQNHSLTVPVADDDSILEIMRIAFEDVHTRQFGYVGSGILLLVNVRLSVVVPSGRMRFSELSQARIRESESWTQHEAGMKVREMYFGQEHGLQSTQIVARRDIVDEVPGPLVIEEADTTVVVRPGWTVGPGEGGTLVMSR
jgi:N-methylhydantoinase A